ncbi:MAG: hypothetical protein WAL32_05600, partial [Terriglobales bacterium]
GENRATLLQDTRRLTIPWIKHRPIGSQDVVGPVEMQYFGACPFGKRNTEDIQQEFQALKW